MTLPIFLIGFLASSGFILIFQALVPRRISMAQSIAPYLGIVQTEVLNSQKLSSKLSTYLISGKSAPWASDKRVLAELRKCASNQDLIGFRFEQLLFAAVATLLVSFWILIKALAVNSISPLIALTLLPLAFIGGGGLRSWLLKETSRKRIKNIESQLPATLDLLAFAVSAGEPVITAMYRVGQTCSGELADEIKRLVSGLKVGDNFLASLDRTQRELGSQSLSRAFRALIMAIERGTPIAELLRAQAMDARNLEARKLITLAGKKETLMMIPVVFLILPMIVIVALYPGLIALKGF